MTEASLDLAALSESHGDLCLGVRDELCLVWFILKKTIGIRVSEEEEYEGVDIGECGLEAYPEFTKAE